MAHRYKTTRPRGHYRRPTTKGPAGERSLTDIMAAVDAGEDDAWGELMGRLQHVLRMRLARFNVDAELKNDAEAETWRALYENRHKIRNPEALVGWVGFVAQNKMIDSIRRERPGRRVSYDETTSPISYTDGDPVEDQEIRDALRRAVARLSDREQAIVRGRLLTDEPASLQSLSEGLEIPVGSIGPTMGRCLQKLRHDPELKRFLAITDHPALQSI